MHTLLHATLPALFAADPPPQSPYAFLWSIAPFVAIFLLFYVLMIRPDRRKQMDLQRMQLGLKKNDHVVTFSGILGVVVSVAQGSDEVTLRVDENSNTRIRVLRSAISRVSSSEKTDEEADAKKSS